MALQSRFSIVLVLVVLCGANSLVQADEPIDFARGVRPIFEKHCLACHGPTTQESGFRLDRAASALKGGDNYAPSIRPGKSADSPLFQFVSREDSDTKMPPKGPRLSAAEVATLKSWIDQGARWPDDGTAAESKKKHWAFEPVSQPAVPQSSLAAIDAFVAAKLATKALNPTPRANQKTLIRRLMLVMHGLPPTAQEIAAFEQDRSPDAWRKLVDRVLASPRYGERWAQHWLDVVRFGETHGFETNRERTTAWPYRDYVIDAFNTDKPYDQFVREQLAGDALGADVGTGFLVAGPNDIVKSQDINLTLMQRQDELADIISTTSTAFLGLTVGCARCHNHKFDPISQRDFYALQAVFAGVQHGERSLPQPSDRAEQVAVVEKRIVDLTERLRPFLVSSSREAVNARLNVERLKPVPAKIVRFTILESNSGQPCLDELGLFNGAKNVGLASLGAKARCSSALPGHPIHKLEHINDGKFGNSQSWISNENGAGWVELELPQVETLDRIEWGRDQLGQYQDRIATKYRIEVAVEAGKWQLVANSDDRAAFVSGKPAALPTYRFDTVSAELATQGRQWSAELDAARLQRDKLNAAAKVYAGTFQQPGPTHRLFRGDPMALREAVAPAAIESLGPLGLDATAPERERRLAFAKWVTRPDHPLTARVWVNRLWQFQFGRGLVETPNDFGANGIAPSHPELLDWLAGELIRSGWSTKHIQRLMLLSDTFQQDSRPNPPGLAVDASCQLLWRFPPRRLEAEAIRDSMLSVTGSLDLKMGGPGFDGFEVQYENVRHYFPKKSFGPGDWRRMVYMTKIRMEKESTFGVFDCPDGSQVAPRRGLSTTPLQALNLLNSEFVLQQSDLFAARLTQDAGASVEGQVRRAYDLCNGRAASDEEVRFATAFISAEGLGQFCRAMLNSNEFLFVP